MAVNSDPSRDHIESFNSSSASTPLNSQAASSCSSSQPSSGRPTEEEDNDQFPFGRKRASTPISIPSSRTSFNLKDLPSSLEEQETYLHSFTTNALFTPRLGILSHGSQQSSRTPSDDLLIHPELKKIARELHLLRKYSISQSRPFKNEAFILSGAKERQFLDEEDSSSLQEKMFESPTELAIEKVLSYLIKPRGVELLSELLYIYHKKKKYAELDWILTTIFCSSGSPVWKNKENKALNLLHDFIRNQQISIYELAETIFQELFQQKTSGELIVKIFSSYTQEEIDRGREMLSKLLSAYHKKKKYDELRWILTIIFCFSASPIWENKENRSMALLYDFIKNQQISTYELAETIVQELFQQKISGELIANIFSLYTKEEIDSYSDPIMAFRSGTLASDLHVKYCTVLLESHLRSLRSILKKYWEKTSPIMFSLHHAQSNPSLRPAIQANCRTLFLEFIKHLYKFSLDPLCENLLKNWRREIYRHFMKTMSPAEASLKSETTGEFFFLKIINPYLTTITKAPHKKDLLIHVAKMLQSLSNQIPPVHLLEPFHDVYQHLIPIHRAYINRLLD